MTVVRRATRVVHINDCASSTSVLMREAVRRGLPWRYLPLAVTDPAWSGASGVVRRALRGARWEARLAMMAARADLLHVHFATVVRHTGWVPRPYLLHLHGTDARSYQYDPRLGAPVRRAIERAAGVLYSTPDLAEHVAWRPDATLLPVPIDTSLLPAWSPAPRPRVVFASRWHEVKGLEVQLGVAARLARSMGAGVDLVGLDWGPGAERARAAGVTLSPRLDHAGFLRLLASAHVVVGQPTGVLAASELEALGIGLPVVAPLRADWYAGSGAALPPVLGGTALADAHGVPPQDAATPGARPLGAAAAEALADAIAAEVVAALADAAGRAAGLGGPDWLRREHGAAAGVDRVVERYAALGL